MRFPHTDFKAECKALLTYRSRSLIKIKIETIYQKLKKKLLRILYSDTVLGAK